MRQKYYLYILFVFMVLVWYWIIGLVDFDTKQTSTKKIPDRINRKILQIQKKPSKPAKLNIPKLNIVVDIEQVGLDQNGKMDVPENPNNVGWYALGYKPGEKGSAVIAGHLDTVTGSPSVFYNLSLLTKGDKIIVTDDKGQSFNFAVTDSRIYSFDQVPLRNVFADQHESSLNLITCEGTYNYDIGNYSHRKIIFSRLIN